MHISQIEIRQDKNGRNFKSVTLDENVFGKNKFNIFPYHTRYADVTEGAKFAPEDFILNGQYIELIDPDKGLKRAPGANRGGFNIAAAQANKAQNIEKAQEHKNENIKVSGTARDATLILTSLMAQEGIVAQRWQEKWTEIRSWLWDNYDAADSGPQPF